jgi:hypothetical protein
MSEAKTKTRLDRLFERIESHGFDSLTSGERGCFALYWLYIEVNNGGLDQFFFNDAGKLAADALLCSDTIGASKTASILRRAISIFPDGVVPSDQAKRRAFLCDSITPEQSDLIEALTSEFYDSTEPLSDLLNSYIEKHPQEFPT